MLFIIHACTERERDDLNILNITVPDPVYVKCICMHVCAKIMNIKHLKVNNSLIIITVKKNGCVNWIRLHIYTCIEKNNIC